MERQSQSNDSSYSRPVKFTQGTAETVRPTITNLRVITGDDSPPANVLNDGDVVTADFSEPMLGSEFDDGPDGAALRFHAITS